MGALFQLTDCSIKILFRLLITQTTTLTMFNKRKMQDNNFLNKKKIKKTGNYVFLRNFCFYFYF